MGRSDFERQAARVAVDAVEKRWQRNREIERRKRLRQKVTSWLALLVLLALGVGLGLYLYGSVLKNTADRSGATSSFCEMFQSGLRRLGFDWRSSPEAADYNAILRRLLEGPVRLSSELPSEFRPKNAPEGTTYQLLCKSGPNDFAIFQLTVKGKNERLVQRILPNGQMGDVSTAEFERIRKAAPYLVACPSGIYLYGSSWLKDVGVLREHVRKLVKD